MTGTGAMVTVEDLVKRYPRQSVNAVDGISFAVPRGEVFGLLGPNGAGKTTTIGVLTTRVRPTSGHATVAGIDVMRDPVGAKRRLAVVPQHTNLDRSLSARQNLLFHAAYFGVPASERAHRAAQLLAEFGLAERGDDKVDLYSGGQSQRIMIARALMHEPDVLFLDEPTTGLDPQARLFVWDRVRALRVRGITIIITTHAMEEAATLCDRVGIMDRGRLLALDTPGMLTARVPGKNTMDAGVVLSTGGRDALIAALEKLDGVERVEPVSKAGAPPTEGGQNGARGARVPTSPSDDAGAAFHIRLYANLDAPLLAAPLARLVAAHDGELVDMRIGRPSLEDVFIQLTGRALR